MSSISSLSINNRHSAVSRGLPIYPSQKIVFVKPTALTEEHRRHAIYSACPTEKVKEERTYDTCVRALLGLDRGRDPRDVELYIGNSLDTILTETRDTAECTASRGQDYDTSNQPHAF